MIKKKKAKRTTLRFYTASDQYTGWHFLAETTYFYIKDWIRSGNYILIGEQRIDSHSPENDIFAILRRKK